MSLKKVGEVKKDKGFKIWDLIIYGAIAVLVAVLFIVAFATKDTSPLSGITVTVQGTAVFKYNFENKEIDLTDDCITVLAETDETLEIKIESKEGFNILLINKSGSAKMIDADCSKYRRDCVNSVANTIKDNSGRIDCLPHDLVVLPYKYTPDNNVIV